MSTSIDDSVLGYTLWDVVVRDIVDVVVYRQMCWVIIKDVVFICTIACPSVKIALDYNSAMWIWRSDCIVYQ